MAGKLVADVTGMYFTAVHLMGVHLTGVHLTGVYLLQACISNRHAPSERASYRRAPGGWVL